MRRWSALPLLSAGLIGAGPAQAAKPPVVVELFTAQGCTGCPQADKLLEDLGARKGVIALTLPVDYWDYLGWADTFAKPAFTERQRAYAKRMKVREIYTPELVVDGAAEASGVDKDAAEALIEAARLEAGAPRVRLLHGGARVSVGGGGDAHADVWLVRYDPTVHEVKVKTGDNKGKLVSQQYVVHELTRLGGYSGGVRTYSAPKAGKDDLSTLILVQKVRGGPILAVGKG